MHEIFKDKSAIYLIMDMHDGSTLNELMSKNDNNLKEETALIIIEQILLTLDFMH